MFPKCSFTVDVCDGLHFHPFTFPLDKMLFLYIWELCNPLQHFQTFDCVVHFLAVWLWLAIFSRISHNPFHLSLVLTYRVKFLFKYHFWFWTVSNCLFRETTLIPRLCHCQVSFYKCSCLSMIIFRTHRLFDQKYWCLYARGNCLFATVVMVIKNPYIENWRNPVS